jgi:ferredoxin
MAAKTLTKDQFKKFVEGMVGASRVVGVKRKQNKFAFGEIKNADELQLDYDVTLASPRAYFQPPKETLFEFSLANGTELKETVAKPAPFVVLGVHTYDLKALNQMDKIWSDTHNDIHYQALREAATVLALEPTKASKWSFWSSMDASTVDKGFDLLMTDIGNAYVIEVGTDKGAALLDKYASDAGDASSDDIAARDQARGKLADLCNADRKMAVSGKEITELIRANYDSPVWEKQAEKCYSCGSCNLVCPTCYCFEVKDDIELDMQNGKRTRQWDGCMLESFSYVGSGENFREHKGDRFRHRIFRKTVYVADKIGELACVGCGRCSEACLPDITDPVKVINTIKEGK